MGYIQWWWWYWQCDFNRSVERKKNESIFDSLIYFSDAERERKNEAKKQNDERIQSKIHYLQKQTERPTTIKSDQIAQTDHQVDRVVYIDEPIPKAPSAATKAFVRNLNSSSVQQNMIWDSESLDSQRTNSDMFVFIID